MSLFRVFLFWAQSLLANRSYSPIAFYPTSVLFEMTNYSDLLAMTAVRPLISGVIDELLELAVANGCQFDAGFKQKTMDEMVRQPVTESIMWQDYQARRPMEVETYLGSPVKLAQEANIKVPRIETLYAMLHHLNVVNRNRPKADALAAQGPPPPSGSPVSMMAPSPQPRGPTAQGGRSKMLNGMPMPMNMPMANGNGMQPPRRPRGASQLGPPVGMRRPSSNGGPPNGYGRPPMNGISNGYARQPSRRGSVDEDLAEEFGHLANLQEHISEGGDADLREREYQLRQRELALREQEMRMRGPGRGGMGPPGMRRGPPARTPGGVYDDDDDDEDYFDPKMAPPMPMIDPDNFDMMSVTSRKNRHQQKPSASEFRKNPHTGEIPPSRGGRFRPSFAGRNRSSQLGPQGAGIGSFAPNMLDDPLLMGSSTDNRYGHVDRSTMQAESRANSMTSNAGWQNGPNGPGGSMFQRRASQSPGYAPSMRGGSGRPSPPNGYGPGMNGRPSPPNIVRQPIPQYPPGHGNAVAPQKVEQHAGVSNLHPPITGKNVPSLTGSASASAGSGDSTNLDTPSAHSSQSSLGPRPSIAAR